MKLLQTLFGGHTREIIKKQRDEILRLQEEQTKKIEDNPIFKSKLNNLLGLITETEGHCKNGKHTFENLSFTDSLGTVMIIKSCVKCSLLIEEQY